MTLAALPDIWHPRVPCSGLWALSTAIGALNSNTFTAADDAVEVVFQAYEGMPMIDKVSIMSSSAFTSAGTLDISIQTLSGNDASGTVVSGSNTGQITVSAASTVYSVSGLAGSASLTPGTLYALVINGAAGFGGNFGVRRTYGATGQVGFPYTATRTAGGAWGNPAFSSDTGLLYGIYDVNGAAIPYPGLVGAATFALQAWSTSTNPDERGNRFVYPTPKRVVGALVMGNWGTTPGTTDDFSVRLYTTPQSSPTQRAIATFADGDRQGSGQAHFCLFDAKYDVPANTEFALAVKADDTDTANILRGDWAANADLGQFLGKEIYAVTRDNLTGNFGTDNAKVYMIVPLFSAIDDGTGGGRADYQLGII